ncbi:MAG: ABC transporter permease [candidate division NC10 bacterium]
MNERSSEKVDGTQSHSLLVDFWIRLVKEKPLGTFGAVITLLLLLAGIFSDILAPYGMNETHLADTLAAPSATYWLGTDDLGRDLFTRVIYGARISVVVGLSAAFIATVLSAVVGMLSGYIGGKFDLIVQRFVDAWMSIPGLVFLLVLISMLGAGLPQVIFALAIRWGIGGSRTVRSAVIGIKENVYLQAAKAIGCPLHKILLQHVLPNIAAPLIIMFTTRVPNAILAEASLSFLGFGVPPPAPSWGGMLSGTGRTYMFLAPWMVIWPGLALSAVVYGVNMFGDAVRDLLDPRLRGGGGRFGVKVKRNSAAEKATRRDSV